LRTTCDGFYAERQPDGRLKTISRTEAIQLQFEGKPWTIGVSENLDTRAARLKQEEEDKAKQAATIAAQREAEEKERKFRESPEYKKQQAEIERKRIADEKEAAIAAKKAQEEAERQKVANARAEQERIQKEEAALKAQRAQEEKQRLEYAKEFPFYAVITCGNNFPVHACFSGDVRTEIELRNGNAYKMYTLVDIMQIRPNQQRGITFDLRNNFELKMQNSQDSLILNLKVYNRATQQIVYEKSAARFGVIRISN
jgi:flagellar biosynthesis GTPase FlhF